MIIGLHSIVLFYEYFYQKKYYSPKYRFKPTTQAVTKIQAFLKALDKKYDLNTLGKGFLGTYFIFQFNRTHKQVFNRFSSRTSAGDLKVAGRMQIYDIAGKQALKYWIDRDCEFDYVLRNCEFVREHKISLDEISQLTLVKETNQIPIFRSEEIEKKRFYNTDKGFLNCIKNTSLFNHKSYNCMTCRWRGDCKKILQSNYKNIYQERGYGTASSN